MRARTCWHFLWASQKSGGTSSLMSARFILFGFLQKQQQRCYNNNDKVISDVTHNNTNTNWHIFRHTSWWYDHQYQSYDEVACQRECQQSCLGNSWIEDHTSWYHLLRLVYSLSVASLEEPLHLIAPVFHVLLQPNSSIKPSFSDQSMIYAGIGTFEPGTNCAVPLPPSRPSLQSRSGICFTRRHSNLYLSSQDVVDALSKGETLHCRL